MAAAAQAPARAAHRRYRAGVTRCRSDAERPLPPRAWAAPQAGRDGTGVPAAWPAADCGFPFAASVWPDRRGAWPRDCATCR
ncbi:MAG: hypothetical protein D3M94_09535 [Rhodocyclales bacterium GT-UBC]|nr:MAG: hypothetical protein D3M94_09535 [Rhodocyclales bacterium GT-UBC]